MAKGDLRQLWCANSKPLSDAFHLPAVQRRSVLRQRLEVRHRGVHRYCQAAGRGFLLDNALPSYFLGVCQDFKQLDNLLTLGNVQTSLALHSLNRRFRLLCLGNHTEHRGHEDCQAATQGGLLLPTFARGQRRRNPLNPLRQLATVRLASRGHRGNRLARHQHAVARPRHSARTHPRR